MNKHEFDLEERTLKYSQKVINFSQTIPKTPVLTPLIGQFVRSGTSAGANYREANEALSKKDFVHRIRISRKEAKESRYWLLLIIEAWPQCKKEAIPLLNEAKELVLIFSKIINSSTRNNNQ